MKIAEISGTRWPLVLASLGALAVAGLAIAGRSAEPVTKRTPVRPYHGCGTGAAHMAPAPATMEDPFVATLRSVREPLTACTQLQTDVRIRLSFDVAETGRVHSIEVRAISNDLSHLDLHVVECLRSVVSPLVFPVNDVSTRISTDL